MSLPEGTPGSRTDYTIEITSREKEAFERYCNNQLVTGDEALMNDVAKKIALLPKKDVAEPSGEGVKPPL